MDPVHRLTPRIEFWPKGMKKTEGQYLVAAKGIWRRWYVSRWYANGLDRVRMHWVSHRRVGCCA